MRRINISIVFLTLAIAATFIATANEKKRTTSTTAYFPECSNSNNWHSVTLQFQYFDNTAVTVQAALRDDSGIDILLYASQSTSTPVKFNCP